MQKYQVDHKENKPVHFGWQHDAQTPPQLYSIQTREAVKWKENTSFKLRISNSIWKLNTYQSSEL